MRTHNAAPNTLWVNPAITSGCDCGATLVRRDTGKCERCTAKDPQVMAEAAAWRRACIEKVVRRNAGVPWGHCIKCMEPYEPHTETTHERYCKTKPHACEHCGFRYYNIADLRKHLYKHGQ